MEDVENEYICKSVPTDILSLITKLCDDASVLQMLLVCKRWNNCVPFKTKLRCRISEARRKEDTLVYLEVSVKRDSRWYVAEVYTKLFCDKPITMGKTFKTLCSVNALPATCRPRELNSFLPNTLIDIEGYVSICGNYNQSFDFANFITHGPYPTELLLIPRTFTLELRPYWSETIEQKVDILCQK